MKIAIDARAFGWTGIGRYTCNLLKQYAALSTDDQFVVLIPHGKEKEFQKFLPLPPDRFSLVSVEPSYYSWQEQTIFWRQLEKIEADLFHFTHFNLPVMFSKPYVVTIHDTTRFVFPGQKRQRLLEQIGYEFVFSRAVERAKAVICVSKSTLTELQNLPVTAPFNTEVIYEGIDESFLKPVDTLSRQKIRLKLGTHDPYLLYVGVWMSHKNLFRLLSAFKAVLVFHPNLKLVMTGKPVPAYSAVLKEAERLGLMAHLIFAGFVEHELLPALYSEASCFVFPSLYEGFGLPPLEAAACGVPVVASNLSSLPEMMGQAAEYVNPEDVTSITTGIREVLGNMTRRQILIEAGKEQAAIFAWETCAQRTLGIYKKALKN